VADQLDKEQIAELKDAFQLFDKYNNGYIDVNKLGAVMKSLKMTPTNAELEDMNNKADADGNDTIDFNEFLPLMAKKQTSTNVGMAQELKVFKVFDEDNNDFISVSELRHILCW
ncbi:hypothetical protein BJ944DRAFT_166778, partial [Cunninghamella echinulata]